MHTAELFTTSAEQTLLEIEHDFQQYIDADTQRKIGATFDKSFRERLRAVFQNFDAEANVMQERIDELKDELEAAEEDADEAEERAEKAEKQVEALTEQLANRMPAKT